jgi:hypothetical protein
MRRPDAIGVTATGCGTRPGARRTIGTGYSHLACSSKSIPHYLGVVVGLHRLTGDPKEQVCGKQRSAQSERGIPVRNRSSIIRFTGPAPAASAFTWKLGPGCLLFTEHLKLARQQGSHNQLDHSKNRPLQTPLRSSQEKTLRSHIR